MTPRPGVARRRGACRRSTHESSDDRNEVSSADDARATARAIRARAPVSRGRHGVSRVPPGGGRAHADDRRREDGRAGARDANRPSRASPAAPPACAAGLARVPPRGKIIWRGTEGVAATLELVEAAENAERVMDAARARERGGDRRFASAHGFAAAAVRAIARRAGVCRPARSLKQARDLARPHAPLSFAAGGRGVAVSAEERGGDPGGGRARRRWSSGARARFLRGDARRARARDDASRASAARADDEGGVEEAPRGTKRHLTSLHAPEELGA